ncbi:transposase [Clostridium gasigenes]|uniref:Transposase n=1 Tax=Clostridium gasigenes TaxID=94869 RepID=A0A1H0NVT2_9CLOT|nr:transposase [Clostridium gasigenes]MBU3087644.1 transposase [Clostridium gasigenes]SDO96575.1 Transposase [Clostridium gasigenes]
MVKLGKTYSQIATEFKEKGLSYSYSSIAKYCNYIKKNNDGEIKDIKAKRLISRYTFLKYFWDSKKITTLKEKELLDESLVKYPHLNEIKVTISGFREIFKNRSVILLNEWLDYYENSSIKQIKSFVNGVRKDYQSVNNCVIYSYNNGVLEGNVNRLKMIKRTMYGRASFHLLRQKVLFNIN